jgi:hypothetical protein
MRGSAMSGAPGHERGVRQIGSGMRRQSRVGERLRLLLRLMNELGRSRQLEHRRLLALAQIREQDNLSIRKLNRVMMGVWIARIGLPKSDDLTQAWISPEYCKWPVPFHFILERDFGTGKNAYGDSRLCHCGKTSRVRSCEAFRYQIVADPCRS